MKILILLLLSFSAFSQVKVEAENLKNGRKFGAIFDTKKEAEKWIEKQVKEKSWGKPERWERYLNGAKPDDCLEVRQTRELDGRYSFNECRLAQEFNYQIIDISKEVSKKKAEKETRKQKLEDLKAAITGDKILTDEQIKQAFKIIFKNLK